jgi:hypothetical protein
MPYKSTDAAIESSQYYSSYTAEQLERKRKKILEQRTNFQSNPNFSTSVTRDRRGFYLSFEDPTAFGKDDATIYELVTIPITQRIFKPKYIKKLNTEFTFFD